ncbi:MAG TPA: M3 family oligoendopeptidase [Treponemataceae bacterium]|nr:M3 family oligoendopeptidase [Treponemataceae bacterium]
MHIYKHLLSRSSVSCTGEKKIIPRWNLDSIYKSSISEEYKRDLLFLDNNLNTIQIHLNTPAKPFGAWLCTFMDLSNKVFSLYESLSAYAYASYSVAATDSEKLNNVSLMQEKGLIINDISQQFGQILSDNSQDLYSIYTDYPQLLPYKFVFEETLEDNRHKMSRKEEQLADDLQRFGGSAWSRLHEQIISTLTDSETGKSFNELRNEAYSADRTVRKIAYEKELSLLKQTELTTAACLNNLKGATQSLNSKRNWSEALDRSLFAARLSKKTLEALVEAIEDSLPFWRSYLKTKAKILDIETCAFYDLFAPLLPGKGETSYDKVWTFDEAQKYIVEKFTSFSPEFGAFAEQAFAKNWIDAEIRTGKVGGAYCIDFPYQKESRVLSNFSGTFSDISTLAHELGHAYHYDCIKNTDYALSHYPMTLAETASIFAETIIMHDAIQKADGFEKVKLIEMHLSDSAQVLVDILSRFYFERSVFELRKTKELNAEDFCTLMTDAQVKTYGNGLSEEKHPYMWAVKSHYYSPDLDFYNFPYAFGLLFATALFARFKKEGSSFAQTYVSILKDTGSMTCEDVCKKAGFDITKKDFWLEGIKVFYNELEELKTYADSL